MRRGGERREWGNAGPDHGWVGEAAWGAERGGAERGGGGAAVEKEEKEGRRGERGEEDVDDALGGARWHFGEGKGEVT